MPEAILPFERIRISSIESPIVPLRISNPHDHYPQYHKTFALIDTGATNSVIPSWLSTQLLHNDDNPNVEKADAYGIGGRVESFIHSFSFEIMDFSNASLFKIEDMKCQVMEMEVRFVLLGLTDFIYEYVKTIDIENKQTILSFDT